MSVPNDRGCPSLLSFRTLAQRFCGETIAAAIDLVVPTTVGGE
jgi:hypothetical protein